MFLIISEFQRVSSQCSGYHGDGHNATASDCHCPFTNLQFQVISQPDCVLKVVLRFERHRSWLGEVLALEPL
jgi:hypothetical protein